MKTKEKLKLSEMNVLPDIIENQIKNKIVLGIDTSGKIVSLAIADKEKILADTTIVTELTHSQVLLPLLRKLLQDACLTLDDIDAIAISNGPGSYTGLRIGISAVKGLCFKNNKKCAGISTLKSLAMNVNNGESKEKIVFSVMRARPDVSYFGAYKLSREKIECISQDTVCRNEDILNFKQENSFDSIILVGDNTKEIKEILFKDDNNVILAPIDKRLQNAGSLCMIALNDESIFDDAYKLNASYLQITKAEKDRQNKS